MSTTPLPWDLVKLKDATREQVVDEYIRIMRMGIYATYSEYHNIHAFKEGRNSNEPCPYKPETKQAAAWAKGDECAKEIDTLETGLKAFLLSDLRDLQALLLSLAEQREESHKEGATDVSEETGTREAAE